MLVTSAYERRQELREKLMWEYEKENNPSFYFPAERALLYYSSLKEGDKKVLETTEEFEKILKEARNKAKWGNGIVERTTFLFLLRDSGLG